MNTWPPDPRSNKALQVSKGQATHSCSICQVFRLAFFQERPDLYYARLELLFSLTVYLWKKNNQSVR